MASTTEVVTSSPIGDRIDSIIKLGKTDPKINEAKGLADFINDLGMHKCLGADTEMYEKLLSASESKLPSARLSVCITIRALANSLGKGSEPYFVPYLGILLELCGDKSMEVQQAAKEATNAVFNLVDKFSISIITPTLLTIISGKERRWRTKLVALELLTAASKLSPDQICFLLPDIIPVVSSAVWETKPEIQAAAKKALTATTGTIDNIDILPFLPHLIQSILEPSEVSESIYKLAATTFVTEVRSPTLAIMTPLLGRALSEGKTAVKRQAAIIVENMCKLVEDPTSTHQFLEQLKDKIDRIIASASDPELREVATRANATLQRVCGGVDEFPTPSETLRSIQMEDEQILLDVKNAVIDTGCCPLNFRVLEHVAKQVASMYRTGKFDLADWNRALLDKLNPFTESAQLSRDISEKLMLHYREMYIRKQSAGTRHIEEEGVEICNCEFSVAYGGMILLNNTRLRLLRGKCYALVGPNGVGKSTLMRSIANGQLDGFPPKDVLKTVFVEHNLQAEDADTPVIDFIFNSSEGISANKESAMNVLAEFGFKDEYLKHPVGALSGGWKMKLELARAMMEHAHILLLDEPTNHLDVDNVKWLVEYIKKATEVTFLIVSHDSSFIDQVCTHVLHFENRKLKPYKGNLSVFVQSHPEARSYYELESTVNKFAFPEPGFLEGIKSKDRAILKMANVTFTYPSRETPALKNVTIQVSLNSRVAVIGPNGAGKSTLVKLLTGVLVPSEGEIWKHPNLRVAYVAQHAFHHVEMHLDRTPNEYVRWRYATGEDKESLVKAARQLTPEEEQIIKKPISIDGEKRYLEEIVGRKKSKRSYEYEIKWSGLSHDSNTWHSRERVEEWGFSKMVQWYDEKEASREGMYSRPLTSVAVQKHFEDVGLSSEFSTHNRIRGLSGGQKVKVVLGSAMWNNPHIVVLDEPTNYLDRDSLGALAGAIKDFGGGVVIISHNREFTTTVCPEVWKVNSGVLEIEGAKKPTTQEKIVMKEKEEVVDAFGNVSKVKSTRKLSRKEQKQKEKRRQMKIKNGYQDKPGAPVTTPKGLRDDDDEGSEYKSGPQFKRKKPCRIGDTEISFWQEGLDLRNPMKECLVDDWDSYEALIEYSFAGLSVDPKEHPVLLCEPSWNTRALREKSLELFFEKFELPTFYASSNGVLTAFASGKSSALVFECAHEFMSAIPVVDGFALKRSIYKQPYAGKYLSKQILELFDKEGINVVPQYLVYSKKAVDAGTPAKAVLHSRENITDSFHQFAVERELAEFKASILQVSEVPLSENRQFAYTMSTKNYELSDGYNNSFGIERFSIPEKLFCPNHAMASVDKDPQEQGSESAKMDSMPNNSRDTSGLTPASALIKVCISSCDADLAARLYPNIVVSGGTTLIPGFTERLNYDLTNITAGMKMRIHSPRRSTERRFSSWIGGSILSSLGTFQQLWISREEYLERGPNCERRVA